MAIVVSAPASTANLGPGFDCLGVALDLRLRVEAEDGDGDWTFVVRGEEVEIEPDVIVRAAEAVAKDVPPLHGSVESDIPLQAGLGSSAAAVACGLLLGCVLANKEPSPDELLQAGAPIEGHPDNLAAALYGGIALVVPVAGGLDVLSFGPSSSVRPHILLPRERLATSEARRALPAEVPMADAVANIGRAAGLVALLSGGVSPSSDRLWTYTQDRLHQPYRAPLMEATTKALEVLRGAGVPAAVSGAGPSIVCLVASGEEAATKELTATLEGWELLEPAWAKDGASIHEK